MPSKTKQADDGFVDVPYDDRKPEKLELEIGDSIIGTLGAVQNGTDLNGNPNRYRVLSADEGAYYLNETTDLARKGIFKMPEGLRVKLTRTEDVKTKFPNPMKTYRVQAPRDYVQGDGDLPF